MQNSDQHPNVTVAFSESDAPSTLASAALALVAKASRFAAQKHSGQVRRSDNSPYINHPLAVWDILASAGVTDPIVHAAAILHDTLEDTDTTAEELEREFGAEVAQVVVECSDDKTLSQRGRKLTQVATASTCSRRARLVRLADKLHNLREGTLHSRPSSWSAQRVMGYFCWGHAVVERMAGTNEIIERQLIDTFEAPLDLDDGRGARPALLADESERAVALERYYACLDDSVPVHAARNN